MTQGSGRSSGMLRHSGFMTLRWRARGPLSSSNFELGQFILLIDYPNLLEHRYFTLLECWNANVVSFVTGFRSTLLRCQFARQYDARSFQVTVHIRYNSNIYLEKMSERLSAMLRHMCFITLVWRVLSPGYFGTSATSRRD